MLNRNHKIFITGASGFVGGYVLQQLLHDGYMDLICLTRSIDKVSLPAKIKNHTYITWVEGDIADTPWIYESLSGVDAVINIAAEVTFDLKSSKKMLATAINGTANIVNASLEHGVKKLVHISSIAAIGRKKIIDTIDEDDIFSHSPYDTTYGLSKFLSEQEVWRGHAEGLNVTILCPSLVLGAGDWSRSSIRLFDKIYKGMPYFPTGTNGWVDVRDVALAVSLSLDSDSNGQRYIISGENRSYQSMMQLIADSLGVKAPKKPLSPWLGAIVWRVEALRSLIFGTQPLLTKETLMSTSTVCTYLNDKSIKQLGLSYRSIDNTVASAASMFLTNKVASDLLPIE